MYLYEENHVIKIFSNEKELTEFLKNKYENFNMIIEFYNHQVFKLYKANEIKPDIKSIKITENILFINKD